MIETEVEKGWDGQYYLVGHAPEKPQNIINSEQITELQNYLNNTDWFAVRFAETGVPVPDDIKAARQSASGGGGDTLRRQDSPSGVNLPVKRSCMASCISQVKLIKFHRDQAYSGKSSAGQMW